MNSIFKLCITLTLVMSACFSELDRETEGEEIVINPNKVNNTDLQRIIDTLYFIPLETPDEAIIGNIKKAIVQNDMLYINDDTSEEVKVFYLSGEYFGKISNHHQGPGGYIAVSNFTVSQDGEIVEIYDNRSFKFLRYDLNNRFIGETKINFLSHDFIINSGKRVVYTGFGPSYELEGFPMQHRLIYFDADDVIVKKDLPFEYNEVITSKIVGARNNLYIFGDTVGLAAERLSNDVYYIYNDTIVKKYSISFGKYNSPVTLGSSLPEINKFADLKNKSDFAAVRDVLETIDYLIVKYSLNNVLYLFIKGKHSDINYNVAGFFVHDDSQMTLPFPEIVYEDYFIGFRDTYIISDQIERIIKYNFEIPSILEPLQNKLNYQSNPVMVFMKFQ